jgi:hypothetical protein
MITTQVQVEVTGCDAPGCDSWCDALEPSGPARIEDMVSGNVYTGVVRNGCGWLAVPGELQAHVELDVPTYGRDPNPQGYRFRDGVVRRSPNTESRMNRSTIRYFCSWDCLATAATLRADQVRRGLHREQGNESSPEKNKKIWELIP